MTRPGSNKVVVVIDGSSSLAASKDWLTQAIGDAADDELLLVLADDHARRVSLAELKSYHFTGGRDNEPALREGIRLAKETGAPVVWIHGPQAVGLSQSEAINQLLERGTAKPVIYEVEAVTGPNRLAEAIYRSGCLRRGPALMEPRENLARFLKGPADGTPGTLLELETRSHGRWSRGRKSLGSTGAFLGCARGRRPDRGDDGCRARGTGCALSDGHAVLGCGGSWKRSNNTKITASHPQTAMQHRTSRACRNLHRVCS